MKRLTALCAMACFTLGAAARGHAVPNDPGYMLRDTTALPSPAAGMARLVVARDMRIMQDLKPEFVYVDRTPAGMLPQRTAVTTEVAPGWHRVWLGRGSGAEVWMEFEADGRYLLRLRETKSTGSWRGDLVRESGAGYAEFALSKGMKLAVMTPGGEGTLRRNLEKGASSLDKQEAAGRERAISQAALPIMIKEAWYLPLPSDAPRTDWENNSGTLTLDEKSLRFVRSDTVVVEIPRENITDVYFGSQRGNLENPWIKVGFKKDQADLEVTFVDALTSTATENYNRLFAELAKRKAPR